MDRRILDDVMKVFFLCALVAGCTMLILRGMAAEQEYIEKRVGKLRVGQSPALFYGLKYGKSPE